MTVIVHNAKQFSPVAFIARTVLSLGLSGRLPTTSWFQEVLNIGSGTVQKALLELKKNGAVTLVSRGHQGTFVVAWDFSSLWDAARLPPLQMLLPPRGSQEATQVASAFVLQADEWGAVTTIGYLRGARTRLAALEAGEVDIVLLSSGSAQMLLEDAAERGYELFDVGYGSYYKPDSLVVVEKAQPSSSKRVRVGIDFHSSDHQRLTRAQFPEDRHEYVEVDFTLLPRAVFQGEIDTGVWHQEESLIPLEQVGLRIGPLTQPAAQLLAKEISSAVLVVRASTPVARLLHQLNMPQLQAQSAHIQDSLRLAFRLP
ncbi:MULTISPECIES: YhfZ family protein [Enterobacterales]|uniref:YhfZ family protein n=1 Tax=Enterobacterales TaxID=91347 RepID=UPI002EDA2CA4